MNLLETRLKEADLVLDSPALAALLESRQDGNLPYARTQEWREEAQGRVEDLSSLVERWRAADGERGFFFPVAEAEPHPELRVAPEL